MPHSSSPCSQAACTALPVLAAPHLHALTAGALLPDATEAAAGFGRWWQDADSGQWVLSNRAAALLEVGTGLQPSAQHCFMQVVPDDLLLLLDALAQSRTDDAVPIDCTFRVISAADGLRWIRLRTLPPDLPQGSLQCGVLFDVTDAKHIAMRERFSFEVTQFLVGTHGIGTAVTKVIQLVCENLGWEWGAYWAVESGLNDAPQLVCRYNWHNPDYQFAAFTRASNTLRMAPGEGLIGHIWSAARPAWIEDMQTDPSFLRRNGARICGLQSGYAFPVAYMTEDGQRHSPGVLEFFSTLSRQNDAQLPNLSAAIGALIAQTVLRLEQQEYILQLSQIDDLTGLANRSHFHRILDTACLQSAKNASQFGLLYIDLDSFKPINDIHGHDAGNAVLSEFSRRLQALATDGCHVGRLGGDEFVMLMPVAENAQPSLQLQALAEQVLRAARQPILFEGKELAVSASVGVSIFPDDGGTSEELLRSADAAMYSSKKGGRDNLSFSASVNPAAPAQANVDAAPQLTIEAELHRALVANEFFLEYQPVFDNVSQRMLAIEALVRWRRPNGEIVQPDQFIPIAENSRLIVQIGRWVVKHACRDLAALHAAGFPDLKVHVNMAAIEFANARLPYELAAVIEEYGIATRHLCLELTEGTVMKHPDQVIPVMQMLRQMGFEISLDDFGIGHSSLSRVKLLPITSIKIDRSFVSSLPQDRGDGAIVRTILDLGRHMHLQVIAEGVENDAQFAFLSQFGCALVQGFLFCRPLSVDVLIESHRSHATA